VLALRCTVSEGYDIGQNVITELGAFNDNAEQ
jgi:hypothetical protein